MKKALIVSLMVFGILLVSTVFARLDQDGWCRGFSGWMGTSPGQMADPCQWRTADSYNGHMGGPFLGYEIGSYPAYRKDLRADRTGEPSPARTAALAEGKDLTFACPR